jgi:hypothetical protein
MLSWQQGKPRANILCPLCDSSRASWSEVKITYLGDSIARRHYDIVLMMNPASLKDSLM